MKSLVLALTLTLAVGARAQAGAPPAARLNRLFAQLHRAWQRHAPPKELEALELQADEVLLDLKAAAPSDARTRALAKLTRWRELETKARSGAPAEDLTADIDDAPFPAPARPAPPREPGFAETALSVSAADPKAAASLFDGTARPGGSRVAAAPRPAASERVSAHVTRLRAADGKLRAHVLSLGHLRRHHSPGQAARAAAAELLAALGLADPSGKRTAALGRWLQERAGKGSHLIVGADGVARCAHDDGSEDEVLALEDLWRESKGAKGGKIKGGKSAKGGGSKGAKAGGADLGDASGGKAAKGAKGGRGRKSGKHGKGAVGSGGSDDGSASGARRGPGRGRRDAGRETMPLRGGSAGAAAKTEGAARAKGRKAAPAAFAAAEGAGGPKAGRRSNGKGANAARREGGRANGAGKSPKGPSGGADKTGWAMPRAPKNAKGARTVEAPASRDRLPAAARASRAVPSPAFAAAPPPPPATSDLLRDAVAASAARPSGHADGREAASPSFKRPAPAPARDGDPLGAIAMLGAALTAAGLALRPAPDGHDDRVTVVS